MEADHDNGSVHSLSEPSGVGHPDSESTGNLQDDDELNDEGSTNWKETVSVNMDEDQEEQNHEESHEGQQEGSEKQEENEEQEAEAEEKGEEEEEAGGRSSSTYDISADGPTSTDSVYKFIEPDRDEEFNRDIELLNQQLVNLQHEICLERKLRKVKQVKRFKFNKKLIQEAVSDAKILYLPGNFLEPIVGRRIDDQDMPEILDALEDLKEGALKGFDLAYNQITDEGVSALASFIQEKPAITHLNLSFTEFTAGGLHTLVTSLMNRPTLELLKLTGVKVGDEGIDSITCLYLCGKGPRDLDVSETDMTIPGFQALCTALRAVDDDDDNPKFFKTHKLPFEMETLTRLKTENHEFLKSQAYHHLCHSQFELVHPHEKELEGQEPNDELDGRTGKEHKPADMDTLIDDPVPPGMETAFTLATTFMHSEGDNFSSPENHRALDLTHIAEMSVEITAVADALPPVDEIIQAHKGLHDKGCKETQPDGRPVIICPSLYSLEVDDFEDDSVGESVFGRGEKLKKVNPMYMDTLVEPQPEHQGDTDGADTTGPVIGGITHAHIHAHNHSKNTERDAVDNITAQRAAAKFNRHIFREAAHFTGRSEFNGESDRAQVLLLTILETSKKFLQAEADGRSGHELSLAELKTIWEYSLQTVSGLIRPGIPSHCGVSENALDIFVEEFMKISSGTFYKFIQVPFFQELFEAAATKRCLDTAAAKKRIASVGYNPNAPSTNMSHMECVQKVILKFLEEVLFRAADIVGGGDPTNVRGRAASLSASSVSGSGTGSERGSAFGYPPATREYDGEDEEEVNYRPSRSSSYSSSSSKSRSVDQWPSIIEVNEDMVKPLVDQLFEAGGVIAKDAVSFRQASEAKHDEGIEPAKEYLEGIFKQLSNFLHQLKDDDQKLQDKSDRSTTKFTLSTKPVRLVLNRPNFSGHETKMASKLAKYLMNNTSVQCLHIRKWGLGEDGTMNLMNGIIQNKHLVTLDLSCNGIGSEGMFSVADFVKKSQTLKHLLLGHNVLRDPGMEVLSGALPGSNLLSLNVAFNDASDEGLSALLEAVGKSNIYSLYILGNNFSPSSAELLGKLFEAGPLNQADCDIEIQDIGGEKVVATPKTRNWKQDGQNIEEARDN